jgi:hypothetical protein
MNGWNEESKCLSSSSLGLGHYIVALDRNRYSSCLYLSDQLMSGSFHIPLNRSRRECFASNEDE